MPQQMVLVSEIHPSLAPPEPCTLIMPVALVYHSVPHNVIAAQISSLWPEDQDHHNASAALLYTVQTALDVHHRSVPTVPTPPTLFWL